MAHLYFARMVLLLLLGSNECEMRTRLYNFNQHNAKTHDNTVPCCLMLLDADSMRAHIDHIIGQCDTTATINTDNIGIIEFDDLVVLYDEDQPFNIETGKLPRVLGFESEEQDGVMLNIFQLNVYAGEDPPEDSWIKFEFQSGTFLQLTVMFPFGVEYMQTYSNSTGWRSHGLMNRDSVDHADGVVIVGFRHFSGYVDITYHALRIALIDHNYTAFDNIRYSSSFGGPCKKIFFYPD